MGSRIGVGVIGCGTVADNAHLPSYFKLPESKLVGVADIDEHRARKMAEKYGTETYYTDYRDLLKRNDLQAVSICTPPNTHSEIAVAAAEKGKHILCEKPMALKLSDADEMIRAAERNSVILMMSFPFRFDPSFKRLHELSQRGVIGKPVMVNAVFGKGRPRSLSDFFWDPEKGGGVIQDIGVHFVDLLRWLLGEIRNANSITWKSKSDLAVEDNAIVSLMFENGPLGSVCLSWTYPRFVCRVELIGEKGIILAGLHSDLMLHLAEGKLGREQDILTIPVKGKEFYFEMIGHFVRCAKEGEKPTVDGSDGKKALEVVLRSMKKVE